MFGLSLTYRILATTQNEAAIDALASAIDGGDHAVQEMAVSALLERKEPRSAETLLDRWDQLSEPSREHVCSNPNSISEVIRRRLKQAAEGETLGLANCIKVARFLRLSSAVEPLILIAEQGKSPQARELATDAILDLVTQLGFNARAQRDQATIRGPILKRLAESTRNYARHRNTGLVDAFLVTTTWGDGDLRSILGEAGKIRSLVLERLGQASHRGAIELLAESICRRRNPRFIAELIQSREDAAFRNELLKRLGREPSLTVQRNFREIGIPRCCQGGATVLEHLDPSEDSALIFLYGAACRNHLETMHLILAAVKRGGKHSASAAAVVLSRIRSPEVEFWMRAAVPVADEDEDEIAANSNAQLLRGLIDLLEHDDPGLVRSVHNILAPLHAQAMLPRLGKLRPRSRRRLGRVIMIIDPEACNRVRDALRHPVLNRRLEAIAAADALDIVDLLSDSFAHISKQDHQEARMLAAKVMANASGELTQKLLEDMLDLPQSPVRDVAERAIMQRRRAEGIPA